MPINLDSLKKRVQRQREARLYGSRPETEVTFRAGRKPAKKAKGKKVTFMARGKEVSFTPKGKRAAARQGKLSAYNRFVRANINKFMPADVSGKAAIKAARSAMRKVAQLWKSQRRSRAA